MKPDTPLYVHYKNRLAQSPIFKGLCDDTLADMLAHLNPATWRKGVVADTASPNNRFHLVLDGRIRLERINAVTGNRVTIFLLGPGDGFDIISLLDGQPHEASLVALEDLELLSAPTQKVRDWIARHPEFNRNFLPYLAKQMRSMENLSADLATKHTATRLASLILRHTTPDTGSDHNSHPVNLIHDLSHDALAHMIGSTRQVVNQHLHALRSKGILDNRPRHLAVRELEALKKQAETFLADHHRT